MWSRGERFMLRRSFLFFDEFMVLWFEDLVIFLFFF